MEWQQIGPNEFRAMVIGGWLIKIYDGVDYTRPAFALTFIPDEDHDWII